MNDTSPLDRNRPWAKGLRALIEKHLYVRGRLTTSELAKLCGTKVTAVAPRMSELEALGKVRDSGHRRDSRSGRGRKLKLWELNQPTNQ